MRDNLSIKDKSCFQSTIKLFLIKKKYSINSAFNDGSINKSINMIQNHVFDILHII